MRFSTLVIFGLVLSGIGGMAIGQECINCRQFSAPAVISSPITTGPVITSEVIVSSEPAYYGVPTLAPALPTMHHHHRHGPVVSILERGGRIVRNTAAAGVGVVRGSVVVTRRVLRGTARRLRFGCH